MSRILIVGAGLAGLTCAKVLVEAGHEVRVLEASNAVGGRAQSDQSADGFVLDRGFQVLFTAYPAAKRHLDYKALRLRAFTPAPRSSATANGIRWAIRCKNSARSFPPCAIHC